MISNFVILISIQAVYIKESIVDMFNTYQLCLQKGRFDVASYIRCVLPVAQLQTPISLLQVMSCESYTPTKQNTAKIDKLEAHRSL